MKKQLKGIKDRTCKCSVPELDPGFQEQSVLSGSLLSTVSQAALKTTFEDVAMYSDAQVATEHCVKVWTQKSHVGETILKSRTANK